jgi:hypothetical protein
MAVNRYAGPCHICKANIPASGGLLVPIPGRRARVAVHLACHDEGAPQVVEYRTHPDGPVLMTRNVRGTCEDAPCCGCCT